MTDYLNLDSIHSFLKGINSFYNQFDRRKTDNNIIWQDGSTRVIDYCNEPKNNLPSLVFIPSLINKSYILDLDEGSSLVRYFAKLGYKVYLIDFTEPLENELDLGFDNYKQKITKAIQDTCKLNPVITIGYCLGGVFSCSINSLNNIIGQILIATPWDFSHLNNPLIFSNFTYLLESMDKVPPAMVQLFFSYLNPTRIWDKFCQFSNSSNQEEIDKFLKVEQWINDGISLTKKFGQEATHMITNNSLDIQLEACKTPCLIINGSEDNIAPISSSMPLYARLANKEILVEKTGHIGLIISKLSQEKIWPKMEKWIAKES